MPEIEKLLSDIQVKLSKIETTGDNTLFECRKTNGRVTNLEIAHNETVKKLAVLDGVLEVKIKKLDDDIDEIYPKLQENSSIIEKIKGNWAGIAVTLLLAKEAATLFHLI